ncbi:hypothetical protein HN011_010016, partial [Eciton burchellii]
MSRPSVVRLSNNQKLKRLKIWKTLLARKASMNDQNIYLELEMLKREIELLKIRSSMTDSTSCTNPAPDTRATKSIERTYRLDAEHTILIGLQLRRKALAWLYSKTEHMELSMKNLLRRLKIMFDHRPSRIMLREKFQKHKWEKDESFMHHYLHFMQKIILGNRLPVVEEELIEYIIDGIPALRNEARVSSFGTRTSFMALFEQVEPDKKEETKNGEEKYQLRSRRDRGGEGGMNKPRRDKDSEGGTSEQRKRNCFNCGLPDHVSRDCPTKMQRRPKCFQCDEREYFVSKCVKQARTMSDTNITRNAHKKYVKEVSINNQKIEAFIDTGSDICVMRAEQYIRVDIPKLKEKMIRFRGVGSGDN